MLEAKKTSWFNKKLNEDNSSKWILVSPLLLILIVFMLYPTFYSLYMSFTDYIMRGSPDFVGLDNYRFALTDDVFWTALWRTMYITVVCLVIEIGLGMAIAILLNRNFPGQDLIKGLCFIPLLIAPLSMSLMWNYMLHIQFGVVNDIIGFLVLIPLAGSPL